jgi:hypothetical protein
LSRSRRRRRAIRRRRAVAAAVLLAAAAGLWLVVAGGGGGAAAPARAHSRSGAEASRPPTARADIEAALGRGVRRSAALGGSVEAAAMLGPWSEPAVAASEPDGVEREMRMWSMSKVVTLVTLLRERGWGDEPGEPLSAEVRSALLAAITRSENCPQRRIVLELQQAAGSPEAARAAVAETLRRAGAGVEVSSEVEGPDPSCIAYLEGEHGIADPLAPALLLGTSTWRVGDAVRFAHALRAGVYGKAIRDYALTLMRAPKERSREVAPSEFTAPLDWGAGRAFAGLDPAYKAGWGGTQQGEFMAGQIALVDLPRGGWAAVAVMFHPSSQPPVDDPGLTVAPRGLELTMGSLAAALGADRTAPRSARRG